MSRALLSRERLESVSEIPTLLRELLAEQARQRETLAAILRLLERRHGARDAADVALLLVIAEKIDRPFTNAWLFAHRQASEALRDALEACDVTNARELGWLCRRLEGSPVPGLWLERAGVSRAGILWRVRVSESHTRAE